MTYVMDRGARRPIILDLCGGTGSWSKPYADAGYDVRLVTLPRFDVRKYVVPDEEIRGVLAAPPCDHFAVSGAQYWKAKDADGRTAEAFEIVEHVMRIIIEAKPRWWALENPVGRLRAWMRRNYHMDPRLIFDPCDYGDPWTKKTLLWGWFVEPRKRRVKPERVCSQGSWLMKLGGKSARTKELRSVTPPGFARAFFEANP